MTFLELEKECKKRRVRKIFLLFILIMILFIIGITIFELNKKNRKFINNDKEVNKTNKKKIYKKETINKITLKKDVMLVPIINLDNMTLKNNKENKTLKKEKNVTKQIKNVTQSVKKVNNVISSVPIPDFKKSISIAKEYLKKGDYKLALKWAKIANMQNKKDKASWIIAAKSLFYLGKKDEAIKVLEIYYNFNKDDNVKYLINKLKSEK